MSAQPPIGPPPIVPQAGAPAPKPDLTLEIHHLDVHGGDSTAIIVKNRADGKIVYKVLIDAGAEGGGSAYLKKYLETYFGGKGVDNNDIAGTHFDCIIATHYHKDHIEGFAGAGITFKYYIDNGGYKVGNETFTPINGIGEGISGSSIYSGYTARVNGSGATRKPIPFIKKGFNGQAAPERLELAPGIVLTCYCANGILANGTDVLAAQKQQVNKKIGPNDICLALVLEWEDFTYFTAGDLSGDPGKQSYYDVEDALLKYLTEGEQAPLKDKTITVLKVSHHGSQHSNQKALFEKLKPECVIIPCNQPKKVPSPVFLSRLQECLTAFKQQQKTVTVMFANSLHVFTQDDRYTPLDKMKDFVAANNIEFKQENEKPPVVSNLGIKAINIRRHSDGKKYQEQLGNDMLKIEKGKYDILIRKRDAKENEDLQTIMRLKTYDLKVSFDILSSKVDKDKIINVPEAVKEGFKQQAEAIVKWRLDDLKNNLSLGKDFVQEYFPGLTKIADKADDLVTIHGQTVQNNDVAIFKMRDDLIAQMNNLFDASFGRGEGETAELYLCKKNPNLNSDEKETLYNLLINNRYQRSFNKAIGILNYPKSNSRSWFDFESWNKKEPYNLGPLAEPRSRNKRRLAPEDREEKKEEKKQKL